MYVLKQWDDYEIKVYNLGWGALPDNLDKFLKELGVHCFDGWPTERASNAFLNGDYVFVLFNNTLPIGAVTRYYRYFDTPIEDKWLMSASCMGGLLVNYRGVGLYRHLYDSAHIYLHPDVSLTFTQHPAVYKTIKKSAKDMKLLFLPQRNLATPSFVYDILQYVFEGWEPDKTQKHDENLVLRKMHGACPHKNPPYIGDSYFDDYLKLKPCDGVEVMTVNDKTLECFSKN